jgi:hypothetical protein
MAPALSDSRGLKTDLLVLRFWRSPQRSYPLGNQRPFRLGAPKSGPTAITSLVPSLSS